MPPEISKQLLSDRVYDLIRAAILDGSRPPGSRVVESEIARSLSISQAPVRDAVRRLAHAGLVTSEPRRGSHVTELSEEDFGIARQLRAALEGIGARAAVEHLTPGDLAELREIVALMGQAVAAGEWAEFRCLDMRFHHRVMVIADGAVLGRVWDTLEPLLISQHAISDPAFSGDRSKLVQWHGDLIAALEAGDPEVAGAAFHAHASGALS
ncbi:GntR family transcriptional regulator [Catenulispora rubra]|uniref:GntR family transcriptional regulator n=1 Tax=Catenulispora rubra TaxID=280293 RepID=UPI00189258F1|nr:GntR family transcriptional regulator [Catenulispora rubra]